MTTWNDAASAATGAARPQRRPIDPDLLAKVCGLLGSDHDGERSAAAYRASQMLRAAGLTWRELVERACIGMPTPTVPPFSTGFSSPPPRRPRKPRAPKPPPPPPEPTSAAAMRPLDLLAEAVAKVGMLGPWEAAFVLELRRRLDRRQWEISAAERRDLLRIVTKLRERAA